LRKRFEEIIEENKALTIKCIDLRNEVNILETKQITQEQQNEQIFKKIDDLQAQLKDVIRDQGQRNETYQLNLVTRTPLRNIKPNQDTSSDEDSNHGQDASEGYLSPLAARLYSPYRKRRDQRLSEEADEFNSRSPSPTRTYALSAPIEIRGHHIPSQVDYSHLTKHLEKGRSSSLDRRAPKKGLHHRKTASRAASSKCCCDYSSVLDSKY
jgi:hypothetical protein